jgi:hypothetical protein
MDYTGKIHERLAKYFESSNEKAIEELYYKIITFLDDEREPENYTADVVNSFFKNNTYYYINTTHLYVEYTTEFKVITENDMIHAVLLYITNYHKNYEINSILKQQLKNKIMKKIKEKSIYNNIPESNTLQDVLNFLHPNFFNSRNYAKYFMITLGDIIMKKNDLFYFIPIHMKPFIKTLNKHLSMYFHTMNLCNHYKFQYHDHDTTKSRIIGFNELNLKHLTIPESFYNNLICISLHYSNRYDSGDLFLDDPCCSTLKENVLWIKNSNKNEIITTFINKYIYTKEGSKINEKDMLFLWKDYLKTNHIMNIFQKNSDFYDNISTILTLYDGCYLNVSSMFLPYVNEFKDFWTKYMYVDETEYEFEINEIFQLFSETYKDKLVDEQTIVDLIKYYYPSVMINDKIRQYGSTLWNKKKEIDAFLINKTLTDVNDLYFEYCNEFKNKRKVSKIYFLEYYASL